MPQINRVLSEDEAPSTNVFSIAEEAEQIFLGCGGFCLRQKVIFFLMTSEMNLLLKK